MNKLSLLLTACVDPASAPIHLVRSDPALRMADYRAALTFWLNYPDARIANLVLVENSGHSLDELKELSRQVNPYKRSIEFIQTNDNKYPSDVDYGYAEMKMIDEALVRSELLRRSKFFIKATGRLRFPALSHLLDRLPDEYLFAVDCHATQVCGEQKTIYVATQLMLFSRRFYLDHLCGSYSKMSLKLRNIECLFYSALIPFRNNSGAIFRWPCNCDPVGVGARYGVSYVTPRKRATALFRSVCRKMFPRWWI